MLGLEQIGNKFNGVKMEAIEHANLRNKKERGRFSLIDGGTTGFTMTAHSIMHLQFLPRLI
jgi:hypothetical protein